MNTVMRLLSAIEQRDPDAAEQLLPLVYDELRKLAAEKMAQEKPGQTLEATALVHEAYLRLVGPSPQPSPPRGDGAAHSSPPPPGGDARARGQMWDSRGHFFAAAAEAMRRILIEQARRKQRQRHGGGLQRVPLRDKDIGVSPDDEQLLLLDDALTKLAGIRPQAAKLVQLRFFSGLTIDEAAPLVGISSRTARRLWVFARAWLRREMQSMSDKQG